MDKKRFKKIYIEITNICNLSCSFCEPDGRKKEFMKIEDFKKIIRKIEPYTGYIYLHVKGEPLLHPNINELIEIANEFDIKVNITTNGTLLKKLKSKNVRQINYSIQSTKEVKEIKEAIRELKSITKETNTYISLRLWREDTKENTEIINLLKEEFPDMKEIKDKSKLAPNIFLSLEEEFKWPVLDNNENEKKGYCYALKDQIAILVDGSVVPCCLDHKGIITLGNILKEDMKNILNNERTIAMKEGFRNRNIIEPLCQNCNYRLKFNKE